MKKCKWITNRGTKCNYKAKTKKGLCKIHYHMSIKQPGKNYNKLASSIATLDNLAKIEATNGHNPELNLKSVIEWLFKTATASEVNAIELVSKLVT